MYLDDNVLHFIFDILLNDNMSYFSFLRYIALYCFFHVHTFENHCPLKPKPNNEDLNMEHGEQPTYVSHFSGHFAPTPHFNGSCPEFMSKKNKIKIKVNISEVLCCNVIINTVVRLQLL